MSPIKWHIQQAIGSAEICLASLASYVPNNRLRVAIVRALGARVGAGVAIHHGLQLRSPSRVAIASDVFIAEQVILDGRGGLRIGPHVSIGSRAQIWTAQHDWREEGFPYVSAPVEVGNFAWISANSVILPGTTIGEGAVVAAGAVVTANVQPWTLVAGQPARVIQERPHLRPYALNAQRNKVWWW